MTLLFCRQFLLATQAPYYVLAVQGGLEPPTYGLTDRRIYQLSYWTIVLVERQGFEPWDLLSQIDGLANRSLRPLGHLSKFNTVIKERLLLFQVL